MDKKSSDFDLSFLRLLSRKFTLKTQNSIEEDVPKIKKKIKLKYNND